MKTGIALSCLGVGIVALGALSLVQESRINILERQASEYQRLKLMVLADAPLIARNDIRTFLANKPLWMLPNAKMYNALQDLKYEAKTNPLLVSPEEMVAIDSCLLAQKEPSGPGNKKQEK